jgi:hypothetical protein
MMYRQNVTGITTSDRYTALYIGTFNNMSTYTRVGVVTGANKVYNSHSTEICEGCPFTVMNRALVLRL